MTAAHVQATIHAQLEAIRAHEPGVRLGADPEELHRMRTAVRRLRALLRAVRPMFARRLETARRELRWLGAVLGEGRDLDVLGQYLAHARPRVGRRVLDRLAAERARAQEDVRAALDSPRYAALLHRLDEALQSPGPGDTDVSLVKIARRQFKRLRRAVKALPERPADRELHDVRIQLKRARYAAELAQAMVGRRAERFVHKAAALQDILGEHQDAATAETRLRALLRGPRGGIDGSGARLLARQRQRRREAWSAFQAQWPKLARRGRKVWG